MKPRKRMIHENQLSLFDERMKVLSTLPCLPISELMKELNISWCEASVSAWYDNVSVIKQCGCGKIYKIKKPSGSGPLLLEEQCTCPKEKKLRLYDDKRLDSTRPIYLRAVHLYPESDQVIRFSFQSRKVNLQEAKTLEGCQQLLDQSLEEIGYLRYHLDGTIEQSGVDLLTETWFIGNSMSGHQAIKQGIQTFNHNTHHPGGCRSMGDYVDADLKQCCYFDYYSQLESHYFNCIQQTMFYTKIDLEVRSLSHPVAQRHPYFHIMSHDPKQSLGYFAKCFLGCYEMFRRYPQMEQVAKAGYAQIMKDWMIEFAKTPTKKFQLHRMFKPGQNLSEIIGLPKPLLRLLREEDVDYKTYQLVLKVHQVSPLHEESLRILLESRHEIDFNRFWRNIREKRAGAVELLMYLRSCWNQQGIAMEEALILWDDYLTMALEANVPFKKFPSMLKMSHDVLARDVKKLRDVREQEMFKERAATLEHLKFEDEETGYGIYVPQTCNDLVVEGRTLHHCVGSYQRRFAKGETTILFIRRLEEPSKPLYTLEWDLKKQKILQLRGNSNSNVTNRDALACLKKWQERQATA